MLQSHLLCHAQGKNMEIDVILSCGPCGQVWKAAQFIFMPIRNTAIQSYQKVSDQINFYNFNLKNYRKEGDC
jgi:hypothetical protein